MGTASNELGQFGITVFLDSVDTLVISSIAHHDYFLTMAESRKMDFTATFRLDPKQYLLETVEVRTPSEMAKSLVLKAIQNKKKNYNPRRHVLHAFFREYTIDPADKVFQNIAKADVLIFDRGIHRDNERVRITLNELRRSDDLRDPAFINAYRISFSQSRFKRTNGIYSTYNSHFLKPAQADAGWFNDGFLENRDFYL